MASNTVERIEMTCSASPSQWSGRFADGRWLYVRYRWGCLTVDEGGTAEYGGADGTEVLSIDHGDWLDGRMTTEDMMTLTGGVLDWSKVRAAKAAGVRMSERRELPALVAEYSNAVGRHGPDSAEARAFRQGHADDKELLDYCDALDRIKRHLGDGPGREGGGKGSGMREEAKVKPCPNRECRNKEIDIARVLPMDGGFARYCPECHTRGPRAKSFDAADTAWNDLPRDPAPPAQGSIVEALGELREAGGKAWDRVEDVDAELGRKPVVGPATKALAEAIQSQRTKVELAGGNYVLGGYDMHVKLSNDVVDAFFAELEADR
jgi:hypothetical protein